MGRSGWKREEREREKQKYRRKLREMKSSQRGKEMRTRNKECQQQSPRGREYTLFTFNYISFLRERKRPKLIWALKKLPIITHHRAKGCREC
jgi:hypothetical protein